MKKISTTVKCLLLISLTTASIGCSNDTDTKSRVEAPKFHTKEKSGVWSDKVDSHMPIIKKLEDRKIEVTVNIRQTLNPRHYIEVIVLMKGENKQVSIRRFKPSFKKPVAVFELPDFDDDYWVVSKCNLHDMWRADVK